MKKTAALVLALILAFSLCSCSSKSSVNSMDMPQSPGFNREETGIISDSAADNGNGDYTQGEKSPDYGYKIIKNADLSLTSRNFDEDISGINALISKYEGYVASSQIRGTKPEAYGDMGRYASLTVRIKQENLDAFLESTGDICEMTYKNISTEDVTGQYFDTQTRLKTYKAQYDRILELTDKAESIEELIALETELTRITYQIEALTTDIKRWDDLISYSTVTINITEKNTLSNVSAKGGFFGRIAEGFLITLGSVGAFFANLFAGIIIYSPVIVIIAAAVLLILFILKKKKVKLFGKRAAEKASLKNENEEEKTLDK